MTKSRSEFRLSPNFSIEELLYEEEGTALDFKREEYAFNKAEPARKSELLKDILAFANAWRRTEACILIGVQEVKGGRSKILGVEGNLDDAQIQQFVNGKVQRPLEFSYSTHEVSGKKIGIIRIPVQTRPFYLKKDYGLLKRDTVYIRRGSSTEIVRPDEITEIGRAELRENGDIPDLLLEFSDHKKRSALGTKMDLESMLLEFPKPENIPDYSGRHAAGRSLEILYGPDPNYYRDFAHYWYEVSRSKELEFLVRNDSSTLIEDVRVELVVEKSDGAFAFIREDQLPTYPVKQHHPMQFQSHAADRIVGKNCLQPNIQDLGDSYRIEMMFGKVQPKRTEYFPRGVYIVSGGSFDLTITATIYADNVPTPIEKTLQIKCVLTRRSVSLEELIALSGRN